jgi:hypothetical protein
VNLTFVLSLIQERSYVVMLGKWWQVLPVLIVFIVGAVWLIMKVSRRKQS